MQTKKRGKQKGGLFVWDSTHKRKMNELRSELEDEMKEYKKIKRCCTAKLKNV